MGSSLQELVRIFQNEKGFNTVFSLFREKYRSYGKIGRGTKVTIINPTSYELQTLEGFLGEVYSVSGPISITAVKFEKAIMKSKYKDSFEGCDMNDLLLMYFNGNLTSKSEDKYNFERDKEQFFKFFLSQSQPESLFYIFVSFISNYRNAPFIHLMYKKSSNLLKKLLILMDKLLDQLPLEDDIFLPIFSHRFTDDFHALIPKSDGGKMLIFALQVLNHLEKGVEIISKPDEEQIQNILQEYGILFCPESNKLVHHLWVSENENGVAYKYQLIPLEKIGRGAFAEVYKVYDPIAKSEMACKILLRRTDFLQLYGKEGEDYLRRFNREIKLLREKLTHRNIIKIDKIQIEHEPVFFTMPLAEESLEKWLELNPNLSEEKKLKIFKDILNGVSYLHNNTDHKISHRDLGPHNILIFRQYDGNIMIKVADFGLAKDHRSISSITRHSNMGYGRESFAAPEQKKSLKNADFLSDIYSLGALLFFIFSGKLPEQRFTSFIKYQYIVGKAMEEDRSKRYQNVRDLMNEIDQIISNSAKTNYSFNSLSTYEFKDVSIDVNHVLKCMSTVQAEESNQVYKKFMRPFLSIKSSVLIECINNDTVMIPFMQVAKKNFYKDIDCNEDEWNDVSLHMRIIYERAQNIRLKIDSLNLILVVALEKENLLAQTILVDIMGSLVSQEEISQQIAYIIEREFLDYHKLLINILKDTNYPLYIRDILNDY